MSPNQFFVYTSAMYHLKKKKKRWHPFNICRMQELPGKVLWVLRFRIYTGASASVQRSPNQFIVYTSAIYYLKKFLGQEVRQKRNFPERRSKGWKPFLSWISAKYFFIRQFFQEEQCFPR